MIYHPESAIKQSVNRWWDSWHRFVELEIDPVSDEERIPAGEIPDDIASLVASVRESTGETFDYMSGCWVKP